MNMNVIDPMFPKVQPVKVVMFFLGKVTFLVTTVLVIAVVGFSFWTFDATWDAAIIKSLSWLLF